LARHLVTKGSYSRKDYILNGNERYCINNESLKNKNRKQKQTKIKKKKAKKPTQSEQS
jgi:peptide methionine sulfoxide reductase MsrB